MNDTSNSSVVFSRHQLQEIPPELFRIAKKKAFQVLDLSFNKLVDIVPLGDEDVDLKAKVGLQRRNSLKKYDSLNAEVGPRCKLRAVEMLYLSNNSIDCMPEELFMLTGLKQLWLGTNLISKIPEGVQSLVKLEILCLNNNQITKLEEHIGGLNSLQQLLLRSNRLGSIQNTVALPEHIGLLTGLKVLDLADNVLDALPIELARLSTTIERLNLEKNLWRFPSVGVTEQGKEAVLAFLGKIYEEKLERYLMRARERTKLLREQPDALGYTRHEANQILSRRGGTRSSTGALLTPLELDSGMQNV